MAAGRIVPTFTPAMLASWAVLATVPLWIERVGLYQYLGVEILIFATYALAFNLVLGHAGLPSFGHGAFFGIGAYAFGLAQFNLRPQSVALPRHGGAGGGDSGRSRCALHLAPARHLLRADDHRLRPDLLVHRHQGTQHHRRRGRPAEDRAPAGVFRRRYRQPDIERIALLPRACDLHGRVAAVVAAGAFAVRPHRQGHQAERDPRALRRLRRSGATRPRCWSSRPACRAWRARSSRWPRPRPSPTS